MPNQTDTEPLGTYRARGYTEGEVEILLSIRELQGQVKLLRENSERYVSKVEFEPVQKIVYGMVGIILVAVIGALVALVVMR